MVCGFRKSHWANCPLTKDSKMSRLLSQLSLLIPSRRRILPSSCRSQCIYFAWWEQSVIGENAFSSSSEFLFMGNLANLFFAWFGSKPNVEISLCGFYYAKQRVWILASCCASYSHLPWNGHVAEVGSQDKSKRVGVAGVQGGSTAMES